MDSVAVWNCFGMDFFPRLGMKSGDHPGSDFDVWHASGGISRLFIAAGNCALIWAISSRGRDFISSGRIAAVNFISQVNVTVLSSSSGKMTNPGITELTHRPAQRSPGFRIKLGIYHPKSPYYKITIQIYSIQLAHTLNTSSYTLILYSRPETEIYLRPFHPERSKLNANTEDLRWRAKRSKLTWIYTSNCVVTSQFPMDDDFWGKFRGGWKFLRKQMWVEMRSRWGWLYMYIWMQAKYWVE